MSFLRRSIILFMAILFWACFTASCQKQEEQKVDKERPIPPSASGISVSAPASFADLTEKASPAVVNISALKNVDATPWPFKDFFGKEDPFKDFFERFFGGRIPEKFHQQSLGSGFIIDKDGLILTNNHVVEKTDEIKVTLADESEFDATIMSRDPKTDLALIKIETNRPLVPLALGDSDTLKVGDWVVAIGNPFGLGHTITAGIVSAKYRRIGAGPYDDFIQTDASINPGNSRGPLLNTAGEAVGINTAIFSQSGGNIGIGFAIPINMAKDLLPQLKRGKVIRAWLGVTIQKITPQLKEKFGLEKQEGALVADVASGGPADQAGIQRGDVIVAFDGEKVDEMGDLPPMVAATPVGKKIKVGIIRKGKPRTLEVTLGVLESTKEASLMDSRLSHPRPPGQCS